MAWVFCARREAKRPMNTSMVLALTSGRTSATKRLSARPGARSPSEVAFAPVVIQAAASRMRRAFITLRKPDESIKHDSNDQDPKLYERGEEIVHRRVLRRCDIKQPTFPEKVCTAYACAEPIEEALAVPERHERNRKQRGRMQKNCPGPYPLRCGDRQHRHPRPGIVVAFGSGETPEMRRRPEEQDKRKQDGNDLRRRINRRRPREHGEASGQAPDHDVPGTSALEPHRVDDAIGEGPEKNEQR